MQHSSTQNALVLIDFQQGFDDPSWGQRNHPQAEQQALRLLAYWRTQGWPVIIVRHDSTELHSTLRPGQPGNALKPGFEPLLGGSSSELLLGKCVHSAFIGTDLEQQLQTRGITALTICGITTDQCVSTTTRMAHNLGFTVTLVQDACACFALTAPNGVVVSAQALHLAHIATLGAQFATVVDTDNVLNSAQRMSQDKPSQDTPTQDAASQDVATKVHSVAQLRTVLAEPSELVRKKAITQLDAHMRAFIALSPWVLVASHDGSGQVDVSPRGDPAGFVHVSDAHTLLIPERPGNRRADTLRNVIETGEVGLLFVVPGWPDQLRVNGSATVVNDPVLLAPLAIDAKVPAFGIQVQVREAYLHCARSIHRSKLWHTDTWPAKDALPHLANMLVDQVGIPELNVKDLKDGLEQMYATQLY